MNIGWSLGDGGELGMGLGCKEGGMEVTYSEVKPSPYTQRDSGAGESDGAVFGCCVGEL